MAAAEQHEEGQRHEGGHARLAVAFRALEKELRDLTDAEVNAFRLDNWPRGQHWSGQDGSIGGILSHVGAWKDALARSLAGDTSVEAAKCQPPSRTAVALVGWLQDRHTRLLAALEPYLLGPSLPWPALPLLEGLSLPRTLEVWSDHDRYHAAQVAYLRERFRAAAGSNRTG